MSDDKPFIWAQGEQANVREPIQALREHGWRHGDVPTASNFNWVLNKMTGELAALRTDLQAQADALDEKLSKKAEVFNRRLLLLDHRRSHNAEFCYRVSSQLCDTLRELVKLIQQKQPDFPTLSWPVTTVRPPVRDELSEIFDEIDRRERDGNGPSLATE